MRIKPVLLSLSAAAALFAAPAYANLIVNGNFEQTTKGGNKQLAAGTTVAAGVTDRTTLTGWTSGSASNSGYNFVLTGASANTGASVLGLRGTGNGYTASPTGGNIFASDPLWYPASLSQTVSGLTVGASYLLTFDYALAQQTGFSGPNVDDFWQVTFGTDVTKTTPLSIADGGFSGWKTASMLFTATGVSEVLSFLAAGSSVGAPPFMSLDNVAMNASAAVPEPSTLSLLLGGIGLAGLVAWRRRGRRA